jgi:hypothetical protein
VVHIDNPLAAGFIEDVPEKRLALFDRAAAQVVTVVVQQIEGEVGEPLGAAAGERVSQCIKMGHAPLVRYRDLAIEHQGLPARGELPEGSAEQRRAVDTVPAHQLHGTGPGNDRGQPVAVMLDLVEPALALRRRSAGRYELKPEIGRKLGTNCRLRNRYRHVERAKR